MPAFAEYSEVAICNLALAAIGRGAQITALDEASQAARICRLRYPYARDAVLRAYDWNFATRRASLPRSTSASGSGSANTFDLPSDCLMVRSVGGGFPSAWVVEGRQVIADLPAPLQVCYTARVADPQGFDPLFLDALAARLAADIAVQLSESPARAQVLWQLYQNRMLEARVRDAQEGEAPGTLRSSWLDGRFEPGFTSSGEGGNSTCG